MGRCSISTLTGRVMSYLDTVTELFDRSDTADARHFKIGMTP